MENKFIYVTEKKCGLTFILDVYGNIFSLHFVVIMNLSKMSKNMFFVFPELLQK
jgi:hypothetical protein